MRSVKNVWIFTLKPPASHLWPIHYEQGSDGPKTSTQPSTLISSMHIILATIAFCLDHRNRPLSSLTDFDHHWYIYRLVDRRDFKVLVYWALLRAEAPSRSFWKYGVVGAMTLPLVSMLSICWRRYKSSKLSIMDFIVTIRYASCTRGNVICIDCLPSAALNAW
jgi:hypothetical protein